jgi:hypothetical protein
MLSCACGNVGLQFANPEIRWHMLCGCDSCRKRVALSGDYQPSQELKERRTRGVHLIYMDNLFKVVRKESGVCENAKGCLKAMCLTKDANAARCLQTKCCGTILCYDVPDAYSGNHVACSGEFGVPALEKLVKEGGTRPKAHCQLDDHPA